MDSFLIYQREIDNEKITTYQNKKVLVLGLAKSGVSADETLT